MNRLENVFFFFFLINLCNLLWYKRNEMTRLQGGNNNFASSAADFSPTLDVISWYELISCCKPLVHFLNSNIRSFVFCRWIVNFKEALCCFSPHLKCMRALTFALQYIWQLISGFLCVESSQERRRSSERLVSFLISLVYICTDEHPSHPLHRGP